MTQPNIEIPPAPLDGRHVANARPELMTVPEVCDALRVSQWSLYQLIHNRRLRTITLGKRRLVAREDFDAFVNELRANGDHDGR